MRERSIERRQPGQTWLLAMASSKSSVTVTARFEDKTNLSVGQGGIFRIQNVPDEQLEPLIAVACPDILFPTPVKRFPTPWRVPVSSRSSCSRGANFEGHVMQRLRQQAESGAPAEVPIQ